MSRAPEIIVHNVGQPNLARMTEARQRQRRAEPKSEEEWENYIYDMLTQNVATSEVMDAIHRYRAWVKIDTYREVSRMLKDNNDGRHARQKIAFMIRREQR